MTLTATGDLDPAAAFFTAGAAEKIVYAASPVVARLAVVSPGRRRWPTRATPVDLGRVLADLHGRGVRRLMVEGGSSVHTRFLCEDLVDELHLVVAPFFVGDSAAPRFVLDGHFPRDRHRRMDLAEVRTMGTSRSCATC